VLPTRNRPDDQQRFRSGSHRVRKCRVRRLVRKIFFAGKEAQKRPPLLRHLIPNGPAQHRVTSLKRVEHRALRDRAVDLKLNLVTDVRQRTQMLRQYDADHGSVCTSTDSTAGKSRTIGAQLSPASAEA